MAFIKILAQKKLRPLIKPLAHFFIFSFVFALIPQAVFSKDFNINNGISRDIKKQAVTLNSESTVEEAYIRLGDLFNNTGERAIIKIAYSPQPGMKSRFDAKWLYRISRAYNLKWRPLSRKTRATVLRASQVIYKDEIEDALVDRLRSQGVKGDFELEFGRQGYKIHVAANEPATISINELQIRKTTGRFVANLLVSANKPNAKHIRLTGRIHKLIQIPVVNRRLSRGEIVQKNDIKWINVRSRDLRQGYIQNEEQIIGMAARRHIGPRTPLTKSQIQRPQLVKKGGIVNIALVNGAMRLTTQGRSLENGSLGDIIRIKNIKTKKIIEARVTGTASAKVGLLRAISLN
jgi:flagella basal body P-ring formation protein FlgA